MPTTRRGDAPVPTVLGLFLTCLFGCVEPTRVPLVVPFAAVGGARPTAPNAASVGVDLGSGLWGQEQERTGTVGFAAGFSFGDRIELLGASHSGTRSATDSYGSEHHGASTIGISGKIRLGDFRQGRGSVALRFGTMTADRRATDVQDERLTAFDLALPVEFYPSAADSVDHQVGLYAAPRLVFERFRDRLTREDITGTVRAAALGLVGRWDHFTLTAELNVVHTPAMAVAETTIEPTTYLFPSMRVLGNIPFGR
jgi:hypothetical protein